MLTSVDGRDDFVKVLDFGISQASWRSDAKASGEILGTPQYMAPEQALGQSDRIGPVDGPVVPGHDCLRPPHRARAVSG